MLALVALGMGVASPWARATEEVRAEPQAYLGDRGDEPGIQNVMGFRQKLEGPGWKISWHWESEILGRRDLSLDLDRAWYRVGQFTLGRAHPWDVSGNPEASRPWGYLAQSQPLNRGIQLGEPSRSSAFPEPAVLGWVGAHFYSDPSNESALGFGLSATPLFVPNLGSEVALSETSDASAGRFGRRPPGSVLVNGSTLPLRFRIDKSSLVEDVLLQPQLAAQLTWRESGLRGWLTVMRAPSPDPELDTSGFIRVGQSGVDTVAEVTPTFPTRWVAMLNQDYSVGEFTLFHSFQWQEKGLWGYEAGVRWRSISASFLDQFGSKPALSTNQPGADLYASKLMQLEARPTFSGWQPFVGIKEQLYNPSTWIRAGLAAPSLGRLNAEAYVDLFGGGTNSYFGEWRTNDRMVLSLAWRMP